MELCKPRPLATAGIISTDADERWCKRLNVMYILNLAKILIHKSTRCFYFQAIFTRREGKHGFDAYRFPSLWRYCVFACTGRFEIVKTHLNGLVPRQFVLRTFICYGLRRRFYDMRETTRHTPAQLRFVIHPKCFSHQGHCIVRRPGCTVQHTPRLRSLSTLPQAVRRRPQASYLLAFSTFTLYALALTPDPAPYCRGEPSPNAELVCPPPPDRTAGGVVTVPLVGVGS